VTQNINVKVPTDTLSTPPPQLQPPRIGIDATVNNSNLFMVVPLDKRTNPLPSRDETLKRLTWIDLSTIQSFEK
jgi:hypothetical protein